MMHACMLFWMAKYFGRVEPPPACNLSGCSGSPQDVSFQSDSCWHKGQNWRDPFYDSYEWFTFIRFGGFVLASAVAALCMLYMCTRHNTTRKKNTGEDTERFTKYLKAQRDKKGTSSLCGLSDRAKYERWCRFLRVIGAIPDNMYTQKRHWTVSSKAYASKTWVEQKGKLTERILSSPLVLAAFVMFFCLVFPSTALVETMVPLDGRCPSHENGWRYACYAVCDNELSLPKLAECGVNDVYRNQRFDTRGDEEDKPNDDKQNCDLDCMRHTRNEGTHEVCSFLRTLSCHGLVLIACTCWSVGLEWWVFARHLPAMVQTAFHVC